MLNDAGGQPQRMVELGHPLRVALGEIIVHRDEMGPLAFQGIEVDRQCRDEGFPFTRFHFRDATLVQDHAADELHIEMPHIEHAAGHLPADGEGFREDIVEGRSGLQALLEFLGFVREGFVGKGRQAGFQAVDALDNRHERLDFAIVFAAEDQVEDLCDHGCTDLGNERRYRPLEPRQYTASFQ